MNKILQRRIIQGRCYLAEKDAFSALQEVLDVSVEGSEKVKESDAMILDHDELEPPGASGEDQLLFPGQLEVEEGETTGSASAGWELLEKESFEDLMASEDEYQVPAEVMKEEAGTTQEISPRDGEEDAEIWYYWNGNFYKVDD